MNVQLLFATIPRMFTALAEWCACLLIIYRFPKRLSAPRIWYVLALALVVQCIFLEATGSLPLVLWIPCMAVAVGLMFLWIMLCCDIPLTSTAYCTIRAFLLAEFAASLEWQLYTYFSNKWGQHRLFDFIGCLIVVYGAVFLLAYCLDNRKAEPPAALIFQKKELIAPLLIGLCCFFMSNLSFLYSNTPFSSSTVNEIYNIRTLVDLAGVAMLYGYHAQRCELLTQRELDAIQSTLQNQYVQYCQSRESIDLINRKYHDLKHQIAVLRAEPDLQRRSGFLDQMEQELSAYQAQNETGNPVLDTVLTSKSMQCSAHKIQFTCVADGALLSFMDVMDICTVFGNILDNAIECELTIPEEEKRMISLKVQGKKRFAVIQCENYCQTKPAFQNGLPVTTKADSAYHGYGIKSIRYTAEKYGGSMTIQCQDDWFVTNIMIPLPSEKMS